MQCLGIDFGTVRIGLAIGDSELKLASPFCVVATISEVVKTVEAEEIEKIVIGQPMTMRSEKGEMSDQVAQFVKELSAKTAVEVVLVDERLSSMTADKLLGKRDKSQRDAVAAMVILQTYFDKN